MLLQPGEHGIIDVFGDLEAVLIGVLMDLIPPGIEVLRQVCWAKVVKVAVL